jgi:hypothetical protein
MKVVARNSEKKETMFGSLLGRKTTPTMIMMLSSKWG